ncbi:acetyltransferase [Paenibacillus sp. P96]|uniref:Acetyltransferase n=1 Tax=Paenibacillus zeirhizosphaerae TaxID=2987519 RepID=A0ABT9FRE1_9BACL|nr:acyltransferase family protein [Paenibacillus sp. P96]MDP4097002.1 acetyltransferase [Paenibacillus sp. P96]
MSQPLKSGRRMHGLDGLRAIAVLGVIAYHLKLDFIPGGLLGVGLFFVLSGYLITDILVMQWQDQGRITLGDFWIKRARRLLPGMLTMTAVVMIWLLMTDPARLVSLRGDIVSGVLYISNWWYIFHHVSYFESFGPPSPFGHFWSLSVEEQFYIVWPLLLLVMIVSFRKKGWLVVSIVVLAGLSAGAMAMMYNPDLDPSRVYYGTDTRAFALLAGAALAVVWPSRRLSHALAGKQQLSLDLSGLAALVLLVYMMLSTNEYDSWLYQGGMLVQALATTVLVAVLAHPLSQLARIIGSAPLRWIGERSYGLYLWHYPVIVLTTPTVDTDGANPLRMALQVLATVILASLSFKYVENPIRCNGFRHTWSRVWGRELGWVFTRRTLWRRGSVMLSVVLLTFTISHMMKTLPASSASYSESMLVRLSGKTPPDPGQVKDLAASSQTSGAGNKPSQQSTGNEEQHVKETSNQGEKPTGTDTSKTETDKDGKTTGPNGGEGTFSGQVSYSVVGDSVILDAKPYLEKSIAGIHVDGKIGRQMWEATAVLQQLENSGQLGSSVVLELGTNGSFNSKNLDAVLKLLKNKKQVYLVTVRVPRPWERTVNKVLNDVAGRYANVSLIDWYSTSKGHDEYFERDGVHLTQAGSEAFAELVKNSVK